MPTRPHGRKDDAIRPVEIQLGAMKFAEGSAQIDLGDTRVVAAASVEKGVPRFRMARGYLPYGRFRDTGEMRGDDIKAACAESPIRFKDFAATRKNCAFTRQRFPAR